MERSVSRIKPEWTEIKAFRNPLTSGEMALVKYLDENLPDDWEIYVQPFLNGDRPDIVILNPSVGVMVFEVKDWQAGLYGRENSGNDPKNRRKYPAGRYYVRTAGGKQHIPDPVKQVERYRENLINLYLPNIGEAVDADKQKLAAFRVGLYFHHMKEREAGVLVQHSHCVVIGKDSLQKDQLGRVVPDVHRKISKAMQPEWADDIRTWLAPPFHSIEQGQNLKLNDEQSRHASPSPHQHQRLRGVAGSGKTLVIAQRAASLAEQGKRVLVVTYNITLWHYIRDHAARAPRQFDASLIEYTHFHGFCKDYLSENDIPWPTSGKNDQDGIDSVPLMIIDAMQNGKNKKHRQYDAILIDEGQDFEKLWYLMLCEFLTDNDELLFVVDERQNIYRRELSWIDKMTGTRFRGRWRELNKSYRLPVSLIEKANQFAARFLGGEGLLPVPAYIEMFPPHLVWKNLLSGDSEQVIKDVWNIYCFLTQKQKVHPADIVFLVPRHIDGRELVNFFAGKGIQTNHVFDDADQPRQHKKSFWMGDSRLKMSTIHSFKGWELTNVVLLTPGNDITRKDEYDRIIYTAITRSRQNLIILNRNPRYVDYGESWPKNW